MTDAAARQPTSVTEDDDADSIEIAITEQVVATILIKDPSWHEILNKTDQARLSLVMKEALQMADDNVQPIATSPIIPQPIMPTTMPASFSIMLTDNRQMAMFNQQFRQKELATNVLSFPDEEDDQYLGDIAIGYAITKAEAEAEGKRADDHFLHLLVHGILHLLGYDHLNDDDANVMEAEEARILAVIGIADPYQSLGGV